LENWIVQISAVNLTGFGMFPVIGCPVFGCSLSIKAQKAVFEDGNTYVNGSISFDGLFVAM
jgi:hypothetical protein